MAKRGAPNKYETVVKPHLKEIKEALERGVEENQIYNTLGVSSSAWCEYKHKYSEFAELFKSKDVSQILAKLDGALMKAATGYEYAETRFSIKETSDGKEELVATEIVKKQQPPNVTAIFGAYNRFDENYVKDHAYYKLKQQELKLKEAIAKANNFDLDLKD